jgi:hypothetical protein
MAIAQQQFTNGTLRQLISDELTVKSNGARQTATSLPLLVGLVPNEALAFRAVIEGMDVQFANRQDHELGRLFVRLSAEQTTTNGQDTIVVTADVALRDWSGGDGDFNGDDPFEVTIYYTLFVFNSVDG